jgi:hypothetical protein
VGKVEYKDIMGLNESEATIFSSNATGSACVLQLLATETSQSRVFSLIYGFTRDSLRVLPMWGMYCGDHVGEENAWQTSVTRAALAQCKA